MSDDDIRKAILAFRTRYETEGILECNLYEGIEDLLQDAVERFGMSLAVASSKTESQLHRLVKHFNLESYFDVICGSAPEAEEPERIKTGKSNKAQVIEKTMHLMEMKYGELVKADETYMIGDTIYDMEGASMQGIHSVGVTYGYGQRADLEKYGAETLIHSVDELYDYLYSLSSL